MISLPLQRIRAIDDEHVNMTIRCSPVIQVHRRRRISPVKTAMMMIGKRYTVLVLSERPPFERRFSSITETTDSSSNYHRRRRRRRQHHHHPQRRQRVRRSAKEICSYLDDEIMFQASSMSSMTDSTISMDVVTVVLSLGMFSKVSVHSNERPFSNRTNQISWHDCRRRIRWWNHRWIHHERVRDFIFTWNPPDDRSASSSLFVAEVPWMLTVAFNQEI